MMNSDFKRILARGGLAIILGTTGFFKAVCVPAASAENVSAAPEKEFYAQGKNRVVISLERARLTERPDAGLLLDSLVKKNESLKVPSENAYSLLELEPLPLESQNTAAPWISFFKPAVVFLMGKFTSANVKIARWAIHLHDNAGNTVRTFSGVGQPPSAFRWNGRDEAQNPVPLSKSYLPEMVLTDYYGASVTLPQRKLQLDQFLWQESSRFRAGFLQASMFLPLREKVSESGLEMLQEMSGLLNHQNIVVLEIEGQGADGELVKERLAFLKNYFSGQNLRLKKITTKHSIAQGEAVMYIKAISF